MHIRIFKEIMIEYDKDRRTNKAKKNSRIEKIYKEIPEIRKIDDRLIEIGIGITKSMILQSFNKEELLLKSEARIDELRQKKALLLASSGYPEDYLDDIYNCKLCKDTGYIENNKCNCLKQKLINKHYSLSNLEEILKVENFEAFEFRFYSNKIDPILGTSPLDNIKMIYSRAQQFVKTFNVDFVNLLFYGSSGLGKTYLSNCIAKDILNQGWTVVYVPFLELTRTVRLERFSNDEEEKEEFSEELKAFYTVDLLILDDLGTEVPSILIQSELFNIINTRILNKKQTIISTNLSPENFQDQYSDRLVSRFTGSYEIIKFIGDDIRSAKKYGINLDENVKNK